MSYSVLNIWQYQPSWEQLSRGNSSFQEEYNNQPNAEFQVSMRPAF